MSTRGCCGNTQLSPSIATTEGVLVDEADVLFINEALAAAQGICALPLQLPMDRIIAILKRAAEWFWANDALAVHDKMYAMPRKAFSRPQNGKAFVSARLPDCIQNVYGCYDLPSFYSWGRLGDFSIERVLLNGYVSGGTGGAQSASDNLAGRGLENYVFLLYEIETVRSLFTNVSTFSYNEHSHELTVTPKPYGIAIGVFEKIKMSELYRSPDFFDYVVAKLKAAMAQAYSVIEFKLPGGVSINFGDMKSDAESELDKVIERIEKRSQRCDYILQPQTI